MLDKIKEQYQYGKTFAQPEFYGVFRREAQPQIHHLIYPLSLDYYHELNPVFSFNVMKSDYWDFFKTFTLRDGLASFGSFILRNQQVLKKTKTHFIIHPDLAPLVPPHLKEHFSCWHVYQPRPMKLKEARTIILAGIGAEKVLPGPEQLRKKLAFLKEASDEARIELYLPLRNDPLSGLWKESNRTYEVVEILKEIFPEKKIHFLPFMSLIERTSYYQHYFIDLTPDNLVLSDSYLNYLVTSRGGTVHNMAVSPASNAFFDLDLSLYHRLQVMPLPEVPNLFTEMIFYRKQTGAKDVMADPEFHRLIRGEVS